MKVVLDDLNGPRLLLEACEAIEAGARRSARFALADYILTSRRNIHAAVTVYQVPGPDDMEWRMRWCQYGNGIETDSALISEWEPRQDAATAAMRLMAHLLKLYATMRENGFTGSALICEAKDEDEVCNAADWTGGRGYVKTVPVQNPEGQSSGGVV